MRRLLLATGLLGLLVSGCGAYTTDLSGGGASLSPGGLAVTKPKVTVSFTAGGQVQDTVRTYASLSTDTFGISVEAAMADQEGSIRRVLLPSVRRGEPVDVVFAVDTTASMTWSLPAVRTEIHAAAQALYATNPDMRIGVIAYRDRPDGGVTYVTRVADPMDLDGRRAFAAIDSLEADGGGDFPEDVYAGLDVAVRGTGGWRPQASHHIVLIGDAPPHDDYPNGVTRANVVSEAREQRIHVHTVAIACALICKRELGL